MLSSKRDIVRFQQSLFQFRNYLHNIPPNYFDHTIRQLWRKLQIEAAEEHLQRMPIDSLSVFASNMPVAALTKKGLHTIGDLRKLSLNEIEDIAGVGPMSAPILYDAVRKIEASTIKDITPKINPDQLSQDAFELLQTLYRQIVLINNIPSLQRRIEAFYNRYKETLRLALQKKGFLGSFFQSAELKESVNQAIEKLNSEEIQTVYRKIIADVNEVEQGPLSKELVIQHYIEENISYHVELERIIGVDPSKESDDLPTEIIDAINAFPINTNGLSLSLRSYQLFGAKYALHFKRTLLGDEMGLGKTVQALALINHLYQGQAPFSIVVCPLSLLANWKREIERFSSIKTFTFHGTERFRQLKAWKLQSGVLLTTYEQVAHLIDELQDQQKISALIVDEAHYIKNPDAKRSKNVYALANQAQYALFMSGTPLENRVDEMKQLISILRKDIGEQLTKELYLLEPTKFKKTIQEVYLRRNRQEVLGELPELELMERRVSFGEEEEKVYREAVLNGNLMLMRRAAWTGKTPTKSPKLAQLLDICEKAEENGYKVLIFSYFRDVLQTIQKELGDRTYDIINGDIPNKRRQEIIDQFSKDAKAKVLLSQITAGGVGLNIQSANVVVLCEPQWKPSIENQAISRVYRMGQSRKVFVYRLITEDSIDERMLELLDYKTEVFDLYARESEITDVTESHDRKDKNIQKKLLSLEQKRLSSSSNPKSKKVRKKPKRVKNSNATTVGKKQEQKIPSQAFKWPSTEVKKKSNKRHGHTKGVDLANRSRLHKMGYQITGKTKIERWHILKMAVPTLGLKEVAYTIAGNVVLRKRQKNGEIRYRHAIAEWENDLAKLKKNYYKGGFVWPSTK